MLLWSSMEFYLDFMSERHITTCPIQEGRKEMFYLTTHSTHFIYGYLVSDIWLRTILIVREETRCRHIGYSFRVAARVLLYAPSHRQDSTYHGLLLNQSWNTGWKDKLLNGSTPWKDRSGDPSHHDSNALTTELHLAPQSLTGLLQTYAYCPRHPAQLITRVCVHDRRVLQQLALNVLNSTEGGFCISVCVCVFKRWTTTLSRIFSFQELLCNKGLKPTTARKLLRSVIK